MAVSKTKAHVRVSLSLRAGELEALISLARVFIIFFFKNRYQQLLTKSSHKNAVYFREIPPKNQESKIISFVNGLLSLRILKMTNIYLFDAS